MDRNKAQDGIVALAKQIGNIDDLEYVLFNICQQYRKNRSGASPEELRTSVNGALDKVKSQVSIT